MEDNMFEKARALKTTQEVKKVLRNVIIVVVALAIIVIAANSFYIVQEAEQAVVSRFGIIKEVILAPENDFLARYDILSTEKNPLDGVAIRNTRGLQFKLPFITDVTVYNARLFTYYSDTAIVNTADKKQYYISIYAQWNIANPGLFTISLRNLTRAETYLDNLIFPAVVQNVNRLYATDFISNKDRLNDTLKIALESINKEVSTSGIEIKDIQVFRTLLPQANLETTYARMTADRAKVAQQLRSEGLEEYQKAIASADLEARVIEADAIRESEGIRGEAEASALKIYAEAYGENAEFFTFWRSLQALEASLKNNSTLVLDKSHPLWAALTKFSGLSATE